MMLNRTNDETYAIVCQGKRYLVFEITNSIKNMHIQDNLRLVLTSTFLNTLQILR